MEPKTQLERIEELEHEIDRLKVSYEKYFRGVDRVEPWPKRRAVERLVRDFLRDPPRSTAARFRFANVRQRLTSLETYWNRIARQIEEGTYERDVRKARRRLEGPAAERAQRRDGREAEIDLDASLDLDALVGDALASVNAREIAARPASPPRPAPPPAPRTAAPMPPRPAPPPAPRAAAPMPPRPAPPPAPRTAAAIPPRSAPPPAAKPASPAPVARVAPPPPPTAAKKGPPPPPPPTKPK
jgi:hypothetical protein